MACSGVKAAAVTMCGTGADGVLTAVISTSSPAPAVDALRAELRTRLETSVIPNRFIFVDIVPLNENGKVDRQSVARLACSRSN
jgi:acyl-CoA synthetase (AMP-forming)/AMP-acid ligase II